MFLDPYKLQSAFSFDPKNRHEEWHHNPTLFSRNKVRIREVKSSAQSHKTSKG